MADELAEIRAILAETAKRQEEIAKRQEATQTICNSNARATEILAQTTKQQAENAQDIAELNDSIAETQAICDRNARAIEELKKAGKRRKDLLAARSELRIMKQEIGASFLQINASIQTLTNAVFILRREIENLHRWD